MINLDVDSEDRMWFNNYIYMDFNLFLYNFHTDNAFRYLDVYGTNTDSLLTSNPEIYCYGIMYLNLEDSDLMIIPFVGIELVDSINKLISKIGDYQPSIYDLEMFNK
jgi:hypothetical protein